MTQKFIASELKNYLQASDIIDWKHPSILKLAQEIASQHQSLKSVAKACFEWVRDEIYHSVDYQINLLTCRASDVLAQKTGLCYAKSHLLAALLRANDIPAGFCYQRLSIDDRGAPYCLHGFNAVYLPDFGWYRIDARGNSSTTNAQFTPPQEQLAYQPKLPKEIDFQHILSEPLNNVIDSLQSSKTRDNSSFQFPDTKEI